jgi:pimeloyl-ACP methyl ester carboxylesterase
MVNGVMSHQTPSPVSAWRSGTVTIPQGRLAYHRTGANGRPLVLAHGLTDNGLCWSRVATALAASFDIVMLDARGHGQSSRISDGDDQDPGQDIAEAIGKLELSNVILMGHSVGARAAATCAGLIPDSISRLILEDPPLLPLVDQATRQKRLLALREQIAAFQAMSDAEITTKGKTRSPLWHEDEFPAWSASKKQFDPAAYPLYTQPWQRTLARIRVPTLLIHGEAARGSLVTPEIANEATALNPHLRAVQIRDAGHNIRRENFSDYLAAVQEFLADP